MQKKLRIAITGGIGAGKSEVSKIYSEAGYPVLFADQIAKDLLATNNNVRNKIISEFGRESYQDGKPDKKFLAEIVFSTPENVNKINSIIHPETLKIINNQTEELFKRHSIVFVESALIYEANREDLFDYVILVYSNVELRISRAANGLGIPEQDVKERMMHQIDDEKKKNKADFVIKNNEGLEELRTNSEFVLKLIKITSGI